MDREDLEAIEFKKMRKESNFAYPATGWHGGSSYYITPTLSSTYTSASAFPSVTWAGND